MSKYIDAEQKITVQVYDEEHEEWTIKETTIECALDYWSNEGCPPAADVQEVKHGRWIEVNDDDSMYRCSACGELSCCNSPYCGECGAKMDEVDE